MVNTECYVFQGKTVRDDDRYPRISLSRLAKHQRLDIQSKATNNDQQEAIHCILSQDEPRIGGWENRNRKPLRESRKGNHGFDLQKYRLVWFHGFPIDFPNTTRWPIGKDGCRNCVQRVGLIIVLPFKMSKNWGVPCAFWTKPGEEDLPGFRCPLRCGYRWIIFVAQCWFYNIS